MSLLNEVDTIHLLVVIIGIDGNLQQVFEFSCNRGGTHTKINQFIRYKLVHFPDVKVCNLQLINSNNNDCYLIPNFK